MTYQNIVELVRTVGEASHDANKALMLTVKGVRLRLTQGSSGGWIANYRVRRVGNTRWKNIGAIGDTPSEAIASARLGLAEYMQTHQIEV